MLVEVEPADVTRRVTREQHAHVTHDRLAPADTNVVVVATLTVARHVAQNARVTTVVRIEAGRPGAVGALRQQRRLASDGARDAVGKSGLYVPGRPQRTRSAMATWWESGERHKTAFQYVPANEPA